MAYLNSRPHTPAVCPACGEAVPPRALACPACGADHRSGWKPGALHTDGLDLADEPFDYDAFIAEEFGGRPRPRLHPAWTITALILLVAIALTWILRAGL